jgi:hypothetical protein
VVGAGNSGETGVSAAAVPDGPSDETGVSAAGRHPMPAVHTRWSSTAVAQASANHSGHQ